jgi:hypothetical protein
MPAVEDKVHSDKQAAMTYRSASKGDRLLISSVKRLLMDLIESYYDFRSFQNREEDSRFEFGRFWSKRHHQKYLIRLPGIMKQPGTQLRA